MKQQLTLAMLIIMLILAGCRGLQGSPTHTAPTIGPAPSPTPTIFVVATVIGEGRGVSGPLIIEGDCVRVNGQALAWKPDLKVEIADDSLRLLRTWNGQVVVFHAGDMVEALGGCTYKGEGVEAACVTPSVEEAQAKTGCATGPYFVTDNIKKIATPAPPPPSP